MDNETSFRITRSLKKRELALLEAVINLSTADISNTSDTQISLETSDLELTDDETSNTKSLFPARGKSKASRRITKPKPITQDQRKSQRIAKKSSPVVNLPTPIPVTELETEEPEDAWSSKQTQILILKVPSLKRKDEPASATTTKARISGRVKKTEAPNSLKKRREKLILKLAGIQYNKFEYKKLKAWGFRRAKLPKDYWPYPHHPSFKLGHDPWAHLNWPAPDEEQIRAVHKLLVDHHKQFDHESYVAMPAHATGVKVTIDAVFQTLFAQSTDNEIAIDTHSRLCNAFPYVVAGKKYVGKIPNWHDIRHLERDEVPPFLQQGGFHEMRAEYVKGILDYVYEKNMERKLNGKQTYEYDENPPDAKDFVPGLLSMDWLTDPELDDTDEAVLGRLIQLNGIGVKSAMCVMAFSMKRPLFVVDVHVLRYAQWLGWVPSDAQNVDAVAMYLHKHIPDDIKYDLHNQIWTHCANENSKESKTRAVICPFCGARPPARERDVSKHTCPLAAFLPPLEKRWGRAYTIQLRQEKVEADKAGSLKDIDTGVTNQGTGEDANSTAVTPALKQKNIREMFSLPTPPSSPLDSPMELLVDSPVSLSVQVEEPAEEQDPSSRKKVKKLNLQAKSHRFEDISKEQGEELRAAGYYLWEFRPMDNTFMEEWGTFEKKPRYKWERDTIMDKDIAVTWERANDVINHSASHKWSRPSGEDIVKEQTMAAME